MTNKILWIFAILANIIYSQDEDTSARDYCWSFETENECNGQIIPTNSLAGPQPNGAETPMCRWIEISYIDGCNYEDPSNPVPTDESDLTDSLGCASTARPAAPESQCVPDDCSLYETNQEACESANLCEWIVNDQTVSDFGRCFNS